MKTTVKKLHIDCCGSTKAETGIIASKFADMLEEKGYRYGYNGSPCERRAASNMPFIIVDVTNGFYWGSKGADTAVRWTKLTSDIFEKLAERLPDIHSIYDRNRKNDGIPNDGYMPISAMQDDHLHNTILLVDRTIAEGGDQIGNNTGLANLLNELEDERIHRGLHLPLVPFISIEYRKGKSKMFHQLKDLKLRQSIKEKMLKCGSTRMTEITMDEFEYIVRSSDIPDLIKEVDAELAQRNQPVQEQGLAAMAGYEPPHKMTLAEAAKPLMSYLAENYCDETIALVGSSGVEVVHQIETYME